MWLRPWAGMSPLSKVLIIFVAAGIVIAFAGVWIRQRSVPVFVVTVDISAYHVIDSDEIMVSSRRTNDVSHFARYPVDGRMVLRRLKKGSPLLQADLGPSLGSLKGPVVVTGLQVSRASILAGALKVGDPIRLLVPVSSYSSSINAVVVSVSRDTGTSPPYALVIALRRSDAAKYAPLLADRRVIVVRDTSRLLSAVTPLWGRNDTYGQSHGGVALGDHNQIDKHRGMSV
jgi:hypothetical protein